MISLSWDVHNIQQEVPETFVFYASLEIEGDHLDAYGRTEEEARGIIDRLILILRETSDELYYRYRNVTFTYDVIEVSSEDLSPVRVPGTGFINDDRFISPEGT